MPIPLFLPLAFLLLLVAFGVKAGIFPLFFWLPASYHTPAFVVSALFAALLILIFFYLTAPIAGHLLGRAGYRSGAPLAKATHRDDLAERRL